MVYPIFKNKPYIWMVEVKDAFLTVEVTDWLNSIFDKLKTKVKQEAVKPDDIIPYIPKDCIMM